MTTCQEVLGKVPVAKRSKRTVSIAHIDGNKFKMTISDTAGEDPNDVFEFTVTGDEANSKPFLDHFRVTPVKLSGFIKMFKDDHRTIRSNKIFDAN